MQEENPFNRVKYPISNHIWWSLQDNWAQDEKNHSFIWLLSNVKNVNQFNKALIYVLNDKTMDKLFPKLGTVKRAGSYFYIDIRDSNRYVNKLSHLLNGVYAAIGYPSQQGCKPGKYNIVAPPSPSGSHVTLDTKLKKKLYGKIGKSVRFEIRDLISYKHDKRGYSASGFDSSLFPCQWYVLRVKLDTSLDNLHIFDPHISVGILARKGIGIRCGNMFCDQSIGYVCGGCQKEFYCGQECAQKDWEHQHYNTCNK